MKRFARFGGALLAVAVLAGCTAGAPATLSPPPTSGPDPGIAQAPATDAESEIAQASTAAPAQPTSEPIPPTAIVPAATAPPAPEPTVALDATAAPDTGLAYRAQSEGRLPPPPAPADGSLLTFSRGPSDRMEVALTFDAGADTGFAGGILDTLNQYGVKATFGMTGVWAQENPDLVRRMVNEGHQIINHTWDHASFTGASTGAEPQTYDMMLEQLNLTEQVVWDIAGYEMKPYVRPPYGDFGPMTSSFLVEAGYYINVMWTCDSFGWKGWDAAQIVSHCTTDIGPGEIILLHVGASAPGDFEAIPGLIETFSAAGYQFVTIEQMLQP